MLNRDIHTRQKHVQEQCKQQKIGGKKKHAQLWKTSARTVVKTFSEMRRLKASATMQLARLRLRHGCSAHCKGLAWLDLKTTKHGRLGRLLPRKSRHLGLVLALSYSLRMRRGELACDVCHHLPQWPKRPKTMTCACVCHMIYFPDLTLRPTLRGLTDPSLDKDYRKHLFEFIKNPISNQLRKRGNHMYTYIISWIFLNPSSLPKPEERSPRLACLAKTACWFREMPWRIQKTIGNKYVFTKPYKNCIKINKNNINIAYKCMCVANLLWLKGHNISMPSMAGECQGAEGPTSGSQSEQFLHFLRLGPDGTWYITMW